MIQRLPERFPNEPSIADQLLTGCCSLELKLTKFAQGELCLMYEMKGELLATGDVADELCDDGVNRSARTAKRQIRELLSALLDTERGKEGAA